MIRTYNHVITLPTFKERFDYLKLDGVIGNDTFGFDRYLNQIFYKSTEWRRIRDFVIVRDCGNDLAIDGYLIRGKVIVHHMNPISVKDLSGAEKSMLNPDYLITVSMQTHNALHYGDISSTPITETKERAPHDTCPWRA